METTTNGAVNMTISTQHAPYVDIFCPTCGEHIGNVDTREDHASQTATRAILQASHISATYDTRPNRPIRITD